MLARRATYLERFNYLIVHKFGATIKVADALSRCVCLLTSFEAELPGMDQIKDKGFVRRGRRLWLCLGKAHERLAIR
jgi:hypothetical protein